MKSYKISMFNNAATSELHDNDFDSLYQEISHDWQKKAERLQQRRWRKIRSHEI